MFFWKLAIVGSWLLDLLAVLSRSDHEKDLEILILRHQVSILKRNVKRPHVSRSEKLLFALLADRLRDCSCVSRRQLSRSCLIFTPRTVLRWHEELVRRKWTFKQGRRPGRPRTPIEVEERIVRIARQNPRMGYGKIEGELLKLGFVVPKSTIKAILRRHGIPPSPERGASSWRTFLNHYKDQMLACDFFTVETVLLQTIYVLFFIELGTRRVHIAGCTKNPDSAWVAQQARNLAWNLPDREKPIRYLIRDRDSKFTNCFDTVFTSEGCKIVLTPPKAPRANCIAERWIRSVRNESLDHILIFNETHLMSVLREYTDYYNERRPHQGLEQRIPKMSILPSDDKGPVRCRNVLGGVIRDFYRRAA
jgi:putative transposase